MLFPGFSENNFSVLTNDFEGKVNLILIRLRNVKSSK